MPVVKQIAKRQKTCKVILLALAELLDEKPLEKVKASDVIERSRCSRSTFYRHYKNMNDLSLDLFSVIVEKVVVISQKVVSSETLKHPCKAAAYAIDELEKDGLLFRRLCGFADSAQFSSRLKQGLTKSCLKTALDVTPDNLKNRLRIKSEVSAVVDMLAGWLRNEYGDLSPKEMKEVFLELDAESWMVSE